MFRALRSVTRVSKATRSLITSLSPSFIPLQKYAIANVHTSVTNRSNELVKALDSEIKAELKFEEDDLGGSAAPTIKGFTVKTNEAEVTLTKNFGDEKIYVTFNVNHSVDASPAYSDDQEVSAEEDMATSDVPTSLPAFSVTIVKNGQRLFFELKLVNTEEGQYDFEVDEFYVAPGEYGKDVEESVYSSSGEFIDPSLHQLLFVQFLEERGLDTNFCQSLAQFSTHHEHAQYVNLLKKIKNFIEK